MIYLDSTNKGSFLGCNQKYYWRHERGLVPKERGISYKMEFGAAFHAALATLYRARGFAKAKSAVEVVQKVFMDEFKNEEPSKQGKYKVLEGTYTKVRGAYLIQSYMDEYEKDDFDILKVEEVNQTVLTDDIVYVDKPDLVIQGDLGIEVWDHKTTGGSFASIKTIPNNQMTGYQWAEKAERICLNVVGVYKTKPLNECFERKFETYNKQQIEDWKEETIHVAEQIKQCRERGSWPKNSVQCMWGCAYEPLCCAVNESAREGLVETMYEVERWEPWEDAESN